MDLKIIPVDRETGEMYSFEPEMVQKMDNVELTDFLANLKLLDKIKKSAETEVKKRLDEGQLFKRISYSKQQFQRIIVADEKVKAALVKKYGWDCLEPLTINQLEKKYGEEIYKDLERYIIQKPKAQAIKFEG